MIHKSELGRYGKHFPHDQMGYVPIDTDSWRQMRFDHAEMDPDEEGISAEERTRRLEYLDKVWWPRMLAGVHEHRLRLEKEHGHSFISRWEQAVRRQAESPHSIVVE